MEAFEICRSNLCSDFIIIITSSFFRTLYGRSRRISPATCYIVNRLRQTNHTSSFTRVCIEMQPKTERRIK